VLSTSVLVLNRLYQPVHVTSVRRAIILLYRGAAKAVDEQYQTFDFESWAELAVAIHEESIGTSSRRLRVPRVILLQAYDHLPRARVRFSRLNMKKVCPSVSVSRMTSFTNVFIRSLALMVEEIFVLAPRLIRTVFIRFTASGIFPFRIWHSIMIWNISEIRTTGSRGPWFCVTFCAS